MKNLQFSVIESELVSSLHEELQSGKLRISTHPVKVYELLENSFPMDQSKIDWSCVPNAIGAIVYEIDRDGQRNSQLEDGKLLSNFTDVVLSQNLSGISYYINDGLDLVLEGDIAEMTTALPKLLLNNGHLYFLAADAKWCISVTMEGEFFFGFRHLN